MNLAAGLCWDVPLGNFNYELGGHIVLGGPKLIVELPSGVPFAMNSGLQPHRNIPVQANESRMAFTCYTAGRTFAYHDQGFQTQPKANRKGKRYSLFQAEVEERGQQRWEDGWARFLTIPELQERYSWPAMFYGVE
jgi:hypothetical protein